MLNFWTGLIQSVKISDVLITLQIILLKIIVYEYSPTPVVMLDLLSVVTPIGNFGISKLGILFILDFGCFFILSRSK